MTKAFFDSVPDMLHLPLVPAERTCKFDLACSCAGVNQGVRMKIHADILHIIERLDARKASVPSHLRCHRFHTCATPRCSPQNFPAGQAVGRALLSVLQEYCTWPPAACDQKESLLEQPDVLVRVPLQLLPTGPLAMDGFCVGEPMSTIISTWCTIHLQYASLLAYATIEELQPAKCLTSARNVNTTPTIRALAPGVLKDVLSSHCIDQRSPLPWQPFFVPEPVPTQSSCDFSYGPLIHSLQLETVFVYADIPDVTVNSGQDQTSSFKRCMIPARSCQGERDPHVVNVALCLEQSCSYMGVVEDEGCHVRCVFTPARDVLHQELGPGKKLSIQN